jgi:tetratricopeptide (TPR) repeat protein
MQHADRLSPRIQLLVQGVDDSPEEEITRLRQGVVLYPDDAQMWYSLGEAVIHGSASLPTVDEVEAPFLEAIRLEPNRAMFYNHAIATAIRERDDTTHARDLVQRFAEIGKATGPYTGDNDPRVGHFALQLIYGSLEERVAARAELDTLPPDFIWAASNFVWAPRFSSVVEELAVAAWNQVPEVSQGDIVANKSDLRVGLVQLHALWRGNVSRALDYYDGVRTLALSGYSLLYYMHGTGHAIPRALLDESFGPDKIDTVSTEEELFHAGALAVDDGRWDDHARAVQIIGGRPDTRAARYARLLAGYGAWHRGDVDSAITLLEQSHDHVRIALWWLGNAYRDAGRWADAERVFGTSAWSQGFEAFRLEPLAQQRLGTVYEAQGRFDEALDAFGYFLEHWADADPELQPLVEETRAKVQAILERRG